MDTNSVLSLVARKMPPNSEQARKQQKAWREANKDHVRQKRRDRYLANKDAENARDHAWRAAHPEKSKVYSRAWRGANSEQARQHHQKWEQANLELSRSIKAAWKRNNPDKIAIQNALRRARVAGAQIIEITSEQLESKWHFWGGKCWMCKNNAAQWDHVIPVSKGGAHCLANLRPSCKPCNQRKGAKWFGVYKLSTFVSGSEASG